MKYTPTIGLEIHAELKTKSKMFCSSPNDPLETRPNVNICPVCMGHPGTLPVANQEAINKVLQAGLALNCKISEFSKFDRKNYFYPDLPKGYQISQYDAPFCKNGFLEIRNPKSEIRKIRITRVHLEEDTARLVHPEKMNHSLVDFNRAGVPLMELVTEPDITNAKEASAFAQELQTILRYLNVSDADMEKGQLRVEVNISLRPENPKSEARNPKLGTKVEVKNLNSFGAVESAIAYEIARQSEVLDAGQSVVLETRGWDDVKGETVSQREKEEAHDYRYFPEPDLPPFKFSKKEIEEIQRALPELPQQRRKRFLKEYKLSENKVEILVQNKKLGDVFEERAKDVKDREQIKLTANYTITYPDLRGISAKNFAGTMEIVVEGGISSTIAKNILATSAVTGQSPKEIIKEKGLEQITDKNRVESIAKEVIAKNAKAVDDFKKGKETALQFLIGQMMAQTRGTVSPGIASKVLRTLLK